MPRRRIERHADIQFGQQLWLCHTGILCRRCYQQHQNIFQTKFESWKERIELARHRDSQQLRQQQYGQGTLRGYWQAAQ